MNNSHSSDNEVIKDVEESVDIYDDFEEGLEEYSGQEADSQYSENFSDKFEDIVVDYNVIDDYSSEIRDYISSNDFGALKVDDEELGEFYMKKKHEQCRGYKSNFDIEDSFVYNFGAAISKAAEAETKGTKGEPDLEYVAEQVLEYEDDWYFMNQDVFLMKQGLYDWGEGLRDF